jgi:hypothetical protein
MPKHVLQWSPLCFKGQKESVLKPLHLHGQTRTISSGVNLQYIISFKCIYLYSGGLQGCKILRFPHILDNGLMGVGETVSLMY